MTITDHGEFYEIQNWEGDVYKISDELKKMGDKPVYFTVDPANTQADRFYRRLFELGKIEMTHIVCRLVK